MPTLQGSSKDDSTIKYVKYFEHCRCDIKAILLYDDDDENVTQTLTNCTLSLLPPYHDTYFCLTISPTVLIFRNMLLIVNVLVAAKILVAFYWKPPHPPSRKERLMKMRFILLLKKLSAIVKYINGVDKAL